MKMMDNGYITRDQYDEALHEKITLNTRGVKPSALIVNASGRAASSCTNFLSVFHGAGPPRVQRSDCQFEKWR